MKWFFRISYVVLGFLIIFLSVRLFNIYTSGTSFPEKSQDPLPHTAESHGKANQSKESPAPTAPDKKTEDTGGKQDEFFLKSDEVMAIENISLSDKLAGLAIVSKLQKQDIDNIISLASNGVTHKEMAEIEALLKSKISKKELDKLNYILLKNKKLYQEGKLSK